jgi:hydroxyacylglutathione hydrolase
VTARLLSLETARSLATQAGVVLLDVRTSRAFARGHPAGALSVPCSARGLGLRARVALPPDAIVVVVADAETGEAAAAQLGEAGVEVRGILAGGFEACRAAGLPEAFVREVAIDELPRLADIATVVDVREPLEWTTGHVPGALLVPLGQLRDAIPTIPRDRPVVAICEAGVRSCTAASILAAEGITDVAHVPEGSSGYRRRGLPLAFPNEEVVAR